MNKATTITVAEAAELYGVAPITIRRYIAADGSPPIASALG